MKNSSKYSKKVKISYPRPSTGPADIFGYFWLFPTIYMITKENIPHFNYGKGYPEQKYLNPSKIIHKRFKISHPNHFASLYNHSNATFPHPLIRRIISQLARYAAYRCWGVSFYLPHYCNYLIYDIDDANVWHLGIFDIF